MKKNAATATLSAAALALALALAGTPATALADEWDVPAPEPAVVPADPIDVPDPIEIPDPIDVPDQLGIPDVPEPVVVPEPIVVPEPVEVDDPVAGVDYGLDYDLTVAGAPYFDLAPHYEVSLDWLYAPSARYVISPDTAAAIAKAVCRVSDRTLVSTSCELFVSDAHGLCWSVEVRQDLGYGWQRVFFVTVDALTGQPLSVRVVR